jgi:hypothetical protein
MKYKSFKLLLIFSLITNAFIGSTQIGMNQWRIHFSAFNAIGICETENEIIMACSNGLVRYDLSDNSVEQLTLTNGLSDLDITSIASDINTVSVGYLNGNFDIIEGNTITNVPWIKKADISGDKSIFNFYYDGEIIYISTGIGLIVFDNTKKEIKDTYYPYLNPVVYDVTIYKDTIYAATEKGIYFAPKSAEFLNDLANWEKLDDLPATLVNEPFNQIETFGNRLFFAYNSLNFNEDTVFYFQDNELNKLPAPVNLSEMKADGDRLLLTYSTSVQALNTDLVEIDLIFDYPNGTPFPKASIFRDNYYWIADGNNGMVKGLNSFDATSIYLNSPATDGSYRMDIQYGKVLVAGGGVTQNLQNNYFRNGVYLFEEEEWTNFNYKTDDSIKLDKDWDFISVAVNQSNTDQFAFASFSEGGLKIVNDGTKISEVYTSENSVLENSVGRINISDLKYDDDGNLWLINAGIKPLKVLRPDGTWHEYSLGAASNGKIPYRLLIDDEGNKWVGVTNVGLVAFNENGTFDDESDDNLRVLVANEGFGNLPSIFVKGLAQDVDGEIWIGTESGLVVLYSRNELYDGGYGKYDANPILLTVNGEVERLLGETYITAIAVDGGNRKWIGTSSSGVFCFSPDGLEEIYRFNQENSPLISDNILDIKIDQLSGEVYFATEKGLVSFRSDASLGDSDFSTVSVFPNPVRPEYAGPITVQGLGYDSDVKITDVSGNLVYQTVSNGGTVIWNGLTLTGERVQSGVYLVWSGSVDGKGKNVSKIVFIN